MCRPSYTTQRFRACAASSGSRSPIQPPMFTSESFLADIVQPSVRSHISRRISAMVRFAWPGSRSWMNQAFSTARVASRITMIPCSSAISRTRRRFASEIGCPPAMFTVPAIDRYGTFSARSMTFSSFSRSTSPLNGCRLVGSWASSDDHVDELAARQLLVQAGRREVHVAGDLVAVADEHLGDDVLGAATLMRRDHVLVAVDAPDGLLEPVEASAAGVGLVAHHDRRPLPVAHRVRAGVGQQVDRDLIRAQEERVPARVVHRRAPLLSRGDRDRLDGLDLVGHAGTCRRHLVRAPLDRTALDRLITHGSCYRG